MRLTTLFDISKQLTQKLRVKTKKNPTLPDFDLDLLHTHYQNRKKIWWFSEWPTYKGPTKNNDPIDPLWSYTQSAKNYSPNIDAAILKNYSDTDFFVLKKSAYGHTSRLIDTFTGPIWANQITNSHWFWRQKRTIKLAKWLYCFPGIKNVYVSGSTALEIGNQYSDIDLAIQAHPNKTLIARFWGLLFIKLYNVKNVYFNRKFRPQKAIRADLGLIYEKEEDVNEYFGTDERLWFILGKLLVVNDYKQAMETGCKAFGSLQFLPPTRAQQSLQKLTRASLWLLTLIIYPLISNQLLWYKLRKASKHKDEHTSRHFCCFYPRFGFPDL